MINKVPNIAITINPFGLSSITFLSSNKSCIEFYTLIQKEIAAFEKQIQEKCKSKKGT